jgi:hypothetical protein
MERIWKYRFPWGLRSPIRRSVCQARPGRCAWTLAAYAAGQNGTAFSIHAVRAGARSTIASGVIYRPRIVTTLRHLLNVSWRRASNCVARAIPRITRALVKARAVSDSAGRPEARIRAGRAPAMASFRELREQHSCSPYIARAIPRLTRALAKAYAVADSAWGNEVRIRVEPAPGLASVRELREQRSCSPYISLMEVSWAAWANPPAARAIGNRKSPIANWRCLKQNVSDPANHVDASRRPVSTRMGFAFPPGRGREIGPVAAARPQPPARENKLGGRWATGAGRRGRWVCRLSLNAAGSDRYGASPKIGEDRRRRESERLSVVSASTRDPQRLKSQPARPRERSADTQRHLEPGRVGGAGSRCRLDQPGRRNRPALVAILRGRARGTRVALTIIGPRLPRKPAGRVEPALRWNSELERVVVRSAGSVTGRGADMTPLEPHAVKPAGRALNSTRRRQVTSSACPGNGRAPAGGREGQTVVKA